MASLSPQKVKYSLWVRELCLVSGCCYCEGITCTTHIYVPEMTLSSFSFLSPSPCEEEHQGRPPPSPTPPPPLLPPLLLPLPPHHLQGGLWGDPAERGRFRRMVGSTPTHKSIKLCVFHVRYYSWTKGLHTSYTHPVIPVLVGWYQVGPQEQGFLPPLQWGLLPLEGLHQDPGEQWEAYCLQGESHPV